MATNKHATIRYHALDECFSNPGRRYFIEDLIEACNSALYEFAGITDGVKRRQIFDDIRFMESDQGWSIPLERLKDGRRVYYRYSDASFSIKNQPINQMEAEQLRETLSILTRFRGLPQFEWMEELLIRLESVFHLGGRNKILVDFEQNPYLKGLNHFTEIFNALNNKQVLNIRYKGFRQPEAIQIVLHPYYLKQYNSRWFLFGFNEGQNAISNLALDRILEVHESTVKYRENDKINFEEYFEDIVGVTIRDDMKTVKVRLMIKHQLWPYIESKPIHGSQKIILKGTEGVVIELDVKINYELISLLFSFGEAIKVIEPESLKKTIKSKAESLLKNYI